MKENPNINELLNSYIDDELTERQKIEVQRLIAHDPNIAKRLRNLQKCRMLVASLPFEGAPTDMAENIVASLERKTLLDRQPVISEYQKGARHLMFRKLLAAAAMLTLVAILAGVIYTIVVPQPIEQIMAFTGRLELKTNNLAAIDAFINKAIKNSNLTDSASIKRQADKNIYAITCPRENLTSLLKDLNSIWGQFDSPTLFVQAQPRPLREEQDEYVVVKDVDAQHIINLVTPPMPRLTGDEKLPEKPPTPLPDEKKVQLTIIVTAK